MGEQGLPATPVPHPGSAGWKSYAGGALATLAIIALSGAIMASWSGGLAGNLLLAAVAAGLLLRLPHTIPLWAGLTLLVAIAAALLSRDSAFLDLLGNLLFFACATGCVWYLWDTIVERCGWRLPLSAAPAARPTAPSDPPDAGG